MGISLGNNIQSCNQATETGDLKSLIDVMNTWIYCDCFSGHI